MVRAPIAPKPRTSGGNARTGRNTSKPSQEAKTAKTIPDKVTAKSDQSSKILSGAAKLDELKADVNTLNKQAHCFSCGKTLATEEKVDYEYGFQQDSVNRIILKAILPGYRCADCELDFMDKDIHEKFKSTMKSMIDGVDDYQEVVETLGLGERKRQISRKPTRAPFALAKES